MGYGTTKPPPGVQINWGHPLTLGLRAAFLFNEGCVGAGAATHIYDHVTRALGRANTPTSCSALWTATSNGMALNFVAQNNEYSLPARYQGLQSWSTAFQFSISTFTGQPFTIWNTGSGGIQVRFNGSKVNILKAASADMGSQTTTLAVDTYHHIGVSYNGATLRFYLNGKPDGVVNDAQTFTNTAMWIGSSGSSEQLGGNCKMVYLQIWDRVLTAHDFQQLAIEPYAMWAPQSPARYFGGVATPTAASARKFRPYATYLPGRLF